MQYGDELVVMVGEVAHLLGGIGTTVWLTLADPATTEQIVDATVAEHGPHPEADELVEGALDLLVESGVVVRPDTTSGP